VLDGELAIVRGGEFSFDALLQRIHPAESRIKRLAAETPAIFILFDMLLDASGKSLIEAPLTADCVVGGFRYRTGSNEVGSLLLGLYDAGGKLDHVGFTATNKERAALTAQLEALVAPPGFTGKAPGGPSRWSTERTEQWQPVKPKLVVEVSYDQVTGNRFRHGTKLVRFRPDKAPSQCTFEQIEPAAKPAKLIAGMLES
jgi:ATP-dependent DNA ligase